MMAAAGGGGDFDPTSAMTASGRGTNITRWGHFANITYTKGTNPSASLSYLHDVRGNTTDRYYYGGMSRSHPVYKILTPIVGGAGNSYKYQTLAYFAADQSVGGLNPYIVTEPSHKSHETSNWNGALTNTFHKHRPLSFWSWRNPSNNGDRLGMMQMTVDSANSQYPREAAFVFSTEAKHPSFNSDLEILSYEGLNSSNQGCIYLWEISGTGGTYYPDGVSTAQQVAQINHPFTTGYKLEDPQMLGDTGYLTCWSPYDHSGNSAGSGRGYLFTYDISTPSSPSRVDTSGPYRHSGQIKTGYDPVGQVYFKIGGETSSSNCALWRWDYSSPTSPSWLGSLRFNNYSENTMRLADTQYGWADGDNFLVIMSYAAAAGYTENAWGFNADQTLTNNTFTGQNIYWWNNLANDPGGGLSHTPRGLISFC